MDVINRTANRQYHADRSDSSSQQTISETLWPPAKRSFRVRGEDERGSDSNEIGIGKERKTDLHTLNVVTNGTLPTGSGPRICLYPCHQRERLIVEAGTVTAADGSVSLLLQACAASQYTRRTYIRTNLAGGISRLVALRRADEGRQHMHDAWEGL